MSNFAGYNYPDFCGPVPYLGAATIAAGNFVNISPLGPSFVSVTDRLSDQTTGEALAQGTADGSTEGESMFTFPLPDDGIYRVTVVSDQMKTLAGGTTTMNVLLTYPVTTGGDNSVASYTDQAMSATNLSLSNTDATVFQKTIRVAAGSNGARNLVIKRRAVQATANKTAGLRRLGVLVEKLG